jgi:hypothetical protein
MSTTVGLYLMDADGGNRTFVTSNGAGAHYPALSPDGRRVAYTQAPSGNDNNYEIYAVNTDGTDKANLTQSPLVDASASWSPDGSRIAFISSRASQFDVYTMNADGTDQTRLTTSEFTADPDWSPDGTRIVYAHLGDIWVMNADGTGQTSVGGTSYDDFEPTWSPDGTKIAFLSRAHGYPDEVYVMDANGGNARRETFSENHVSGPSWQPLAPNRSPQCSRVRATPSYLGSANNRLLPVTISGAADPDGDHVRLTITDVMQDEPIGANADAFAMSAPDRVRLRKERDAQGDGRAYSIAFEATDGKGGSCEGSATAMVRNGTQSVNSAARYGSFGP